MIASLRSWPKVAFAAFELLTVQATEAALIGLLYNFFDIVIIWANRLNSCSFELVSLGFGVI